MLLLPANHCVCYTCECARAALHVQHRRVSAWLQGWLPNMAALQVLAGPVASLRRRPAPLHIVPAHWHEPAELQWRSARTIRRARPCVVGAVAGQPRSHTHHSTQFANVHIGVAYQPEFVAGAQRDTNGARPELPVDYCPKGTPGLGRLGKVDDSESDESRAELERAPR